MTIERSRVLLVIAGPTGVGKTATAVELATRVPIEVISADSRQVYRYMDVATGKPSAAERAAVPHHLVDVVDPDDRYNAARFRRDAVAAIAQVRERGRLPAVVGGTGLYIRALLRGLDVAPPADPVFRAELAGIASREGARALHRQLADVAPRLAQKLHPHDAVRIIRALERARTGETDERAWSSGASDFDLVYIGLTIQRERLGGELRARAAAMVTRGLAEEVASLLRRGYAASLPAMQGIGYRDFVRVLSGASTAEEALRTMQRDTVRYAKRQWTWFGREPGIEWLDVERGGGVSRIAALIEGRLRAKGVVA